MNGDDLGGCLLEGRHAVGAAAGRAGVAAHAGDPAVGEGLLTGLGQWDEVEAAESSFRTVIDIGLSTSSGFQLVMPFPMKFIGDQRHRVHLLLGDRDARGIVSVVDFRLDPEPFGRPRVPDAVHDGFVRRQRRAAPVAVMWQKSRCSILFHLLVPGGK